jgi:peptidoglycan DL-endopeptidase CwlO
MRDLALDEYWAASLERSQRRRAVRRRSALVQRGSGPASIMLSTLVLTGVTAGTAAAADLGIGDSGAAVSALQRALGIDADGQFGPITRRAVKRYQRAHGIPATGHVGPLTSAALHLDDDSEATDAPGPIDVRAMQRALGVTADGVIGPITRGALMAFESAHGLPADGRPDADSFRLLTAQPQPKTAAPAAPVSSGASAAVAAAVAKVGAPYSAGATGPNSFDCSGLVLYAFKAAGITLPRTSYAMYGVGTSVTRSQIQAGDLVFFNANGSGASHVGIATSPTTAVSATTHGVMQHAIFDDYWGSHYVGARRV